MAIKANNQQPIKTGDVVVGVDVAKRRHVAAIRLPDGHIQRPFSFMNDWNGFTKLWERVVSVATAGEVSGVRFGLEATGHYGHALQHFLLSRGAEVISINPAHTRKVKELLDGSPEKSDPKDAMLLADLVAQGRGRPLVMPMGVYAELRRLGKLREQLAMERTRHLNRYLGLVDLVFPELDGLVHDVGCVSIRRLLAEYPTAMDVAAGSFQDICLLLRRVSFGHFGEARSRQIYEAAQRSVGVREGLSALRLQMRLALTAYDFVSAQMAEVEQAQNEILTQIPYAARLLTIPGLGPVTVATVLGETGDLREYGCGAALIKLAGLNLYSLSSGTHQGRTRISKRGRPLLRKVLFLAALRMSKQGQPLAAFRGRLSERLAGPQVGVAGCRKLLRLMYAIARDDIDYAPNRLAVAASGKIAA
ncbi:MAG: IS110 family transposase [Deltaproteobacteria bacterium]|nr:IS110 family transposase [Deltaproteobacteria bacterium]